MRFEGLVLNLRWGVSFVLNFFGGSWSGSGHGVGWVGGAKERREQKGKRLRWEEMKERGMGEDVSWKDHRIASHCIILKT